MKDPAVKSVIVVRMFAESLVVLRVKRAYFEFVYVSSIRISESSSYKNGIFA